MKRAILSTAILLLSLLVLSSEATEADGDLATELRRASQELFDAVAPGNVAVWERHLHPRYLQMDENGEVRDRAETLAELQPLPPGLVGKIAIDRFRVERSGDTAVVALEIQENLDYHGQVLHTRFRSFDTWVSTDKGWRLLGQHVAAVLKDPPAIVLPSADLCAYAGRYQLEEGLETVVRCEGGKLRAKRTGREEVVYEAELRDLFFAPGQPRSRRVFLRDAAGRIEAFADRREGEDIVWRRLPDDPAPPKPR